MLVLAICCMTTPALASLDTCLDRGTAPHERIDACAVTIDGGDLDDLDLAAAYRGRGIAYSDSGLYREAIPDLTRASRLDPTDTATWLARAAAFAKSGSLEGARIDYRRVLKLDPQNMAAIQGCSDVLVRMGYQDQLEKALEHACAIVRYDESAIAWAQANREFTQEPDTSTSLNRTRREFDDAVLNHLQQMSDAQKGGDWFRAAIYYTRAMEADPNAVFCLWGMKRGFDGELMRQYDMLLRPELYAYGPIPRSLPELQAVLSENPEDTDALRERALLFAASGGAALALRDLDTALEFEPDSAELLVLAAKIKQDIPESPAYWALMRDFWARHNRADVRDPLAYRFGLPNAVRSYYKPEAWLATIERAIALGADDFFARYTYALILQAVMYGEGDVTRDEWLAAWDSAIELLPDWPESSQKRVLGYILYSERASIMMDYTDMDAFMDAWDLALDPPGVESGLYDPRCYLP